MYFFAWNKHGFCGCIGQCQSLSPRRVGGIGGIFFVASMRHKRYLQAAEVEHGKHAHDHDDGNGQNEAHGRRVRVEAVWDEREDGEAQKPREVGLEQHADDERDEERGVGHVHEAREVCVGDGKVRG